MKRKITITIAEKVLKNVDSIVDRVYIRNRSQAVEYLIEKTLGEAKTAVILATGPVQQLQIGRSEYQATISLGTTSVIEIALRNLRENGFKKIFIVGDPLVLTAIFSRVGDGKRYGVQISFVEDRDPPGTGESLRLLKGELKSTFLVVFGDMIFTRIDINKLWKHHFRHRGIATIMVNDRALIKGGTAVPINANTVEMDGDLAICVHRKSLSAAKSRSEPSLVFSSLFVAEPEIFSYTGNWIENDIFPVLAEKQLLYCYVSSEQALHIHSRDDVRLARSLRFERPT